MFLSVQPETAGKQLAAASVTLAEIKTTAQPYIRCSSCQVHQCVAVIITMLAEDALKALRCSPARASVLSVHAGACRHTD